MPEVLTRQIFPHAADFSGSMQQQTAIKLIMAFSDAFGVRLRFLGRFRFAGKAVHHDAIDVNQRFYAFARAHHLA